MKRELFVGGLFVVLLAMLLSATLLVRDLHFFDQKKGEFRMQARFDDVAGLVANAPVWVYGTPGGYVEAIDMGAISSGATAERPVLVTLVLDEDPKKIPFPKVSIRQKSALGGAVVAIGAGAAVERLPDGTERRNAAWDGAAVLDGKSMSDPFHEISAFIEENKTAFQSALKNVEKVSGDLAKRSDRIVENLDRSVSNVESVTSKLADPKDPGTMSQLIHSGKAHEELLAAIDSVKKLADDARTGEGPLNTLLHDAQLTKDLKDSVANLKSVTEKLERGDGTIARLLNDRKPFDDLSAALADLRTFTSDVRSGRGTIGKLVYDEQFAKRLDTISEDVAQITGKIRRGEGTLGKLVNDDTVYADLKSALKGLRAGSDDVRENAPVLTFAGFLFSGF